MQRILNLTKLLTEHIIAYGHELIRQTQSCNDHYIGFSEACQSYISSFERELVDFDTMIINIFKTQFTISQVLFKSVTDLKDTIKLALSLNFKHQEQKYLSCFMAMFSRLSLGYFLSPQGYQRIQQLSSSSSSLTEKETCSLRTLISINVHIAIKHTVAKITRDKVNTEFINKSIIHLLEQECLANAVMKKQIEVLSQDEKERNQTLVREHEREVMELRSQIELSKRQNMELQQELDQAKIRFADCHKLLTEKQKQYELYEIEKNFSRDLDASRSTTARNYDGAQSHHKDKHNHKSKSKGKDKGKEGERAGEFMNQTFTGKRSLFFDHGDSISLNNMTIQ